MKVLMCGATGFIGRQVFETLAEKADALGIEEITLTSRKLPLPEFFSKFQNQSFRITPLQWDVVKDDPNQFSESLKQCTHIFYSVQFPGHPVEDPKNGLTYSNYDFGGLHNVITALGHETPRRVLYMSGAGAGQKRSEPWFRAKDNAEKLLEDWSKQCGGSFLSFRPSLVYGENDVSLNRFLKIASKTGVVPLLGKGDTLIHPIWVQDLAKAFLEFGLKKNWMGCFNLPGPRALTFKETVEMYLEAKKVRALFIPSPLSVVRLASSVVARFPGQLLSPDAVKFLTQSPPMPLPSDPAAREELISFIAQCRTPEQAFRLYKS